MSFGKNRVQYTDFEWTFYQFKRFDTYFYKGGKELAEFTGRTADGEIEEIEKLFDYNTDGRLQFMIFNKLSDLKQSNIGLDAEYQLNNTGGYTKIVGNKILVYFDGDHRHLREQIRGGIARVLFDQLMYGGSVKDRLQSSILLNIPDWYVNGLTQWVARGWTVDDDNRMRDGILSGRYKKLNKAATEDADFAGQSVWNFINETYGQAAVANMLYMARLNRNIESGFNFVIGASLKDVTKAWLVYYEKRYLNNDNGKQQPIGKPLSIKTKQNRIVNQFKLSPDGNKAAYVTNELGKYRVYVYDLKTGKKKKVAKGGYKSIVQKVDDSFPLLAWQPSGKSLTMIKEKKGNLWLDNYNIKNRKTDHSKLMYFEKVHDFSYSDDGQNIVMSATQKGQSDIFVWNVRARATTQVTKDLYDDLQPHFTNGSTRIIFASNRTNDTLGAGSFYTDAQKKKDIFLYDYATRSEILARITNTPGVEEFQPMESDSSRYIYLSDANGFRNRHLATVDSTISFVDTVEHYRFIVRTFTQTNYARNVVQHDINYRHNKYAEQFLSGGKYVLVVNPLPQDGLSSNAEIAAPVNTTSITEKPKQKSLKDLLAVKTVEEPKTETPDSSKVDINNFVFQSEFKKKNREVVQQVVQSDTSLFKNTTESDPFKSGLADAIAKTRESAASVGMADSAAPPYRLPKQRNYDLAFSTQYFVTQLDNSLLNATYQSYTGGAVYFDPGLNGLFVVGINDLMDDYKLIGGFRISGNLNSNEYYASYENLKKRIDKTITFYRQAREDYIGIAALKIHTHEVQYKLKYPFTDVASLRGIAGIRSDRTVILSTDYPTLIYPNEYQYWATLKLQYVFDNTISTGVNLMRGTRYKIFAEAFKQVDHKNTLLTVFGADFRTYTKISRQIIWANRFAASTSLGDLKLIYYLGSTDNAISPSDNFDNTIRVDETQHYAFQAVATNMRGFKQNIRNGNSFALINSEIRIPIFQYFAQAPIRSDFIRNFMVVPFFDVGTAWTSYSPYSKDNNLNLDIIVSGPLTITVNKNTDPIVAGYGFGLRSRLLGYYMRADWGWSYSDGEYSKKSLFNFSLSLDF
ncbi:MAG: hypothetical protein ABI723_18960 [Bacteroidia bacterium]